MNDLSKLSVGDEVAILVPMTPRDLDGCRFMHLVAGRVVKVNTRYIMARHGDHEARYDIDTGEQINGRNEDRGPSRIEPMTGDAKTRIAEGALKKSNYERRNRAHEAIYDLAMRLTTEALERTAEFMAREDEILETA